MKFSAVLLTGGKSTRMGSDKASLPYQGGLLWEHQIQTLLRAGAVEILISGPEQGIYENSGCIIIPDELPERGPIEGLRRGLTKAISGHVLLLAIDLPRMRWDYLTRLWTLCEPGCGVAGIDQAYEPLAAFYPKEILPLLENHILEKEYSFQNLIKQAESLDLMTTCPITKSDSVFFLNWNHKNA